MSIRKNMESTPEQTRDRLIEAAGEVFAERGFRDATVREICQRGKANVAAVNYHFGDKQALYLEAVRRAQCTGPSLIGITWPPGWTPQQKLRAFIQKWLEHFLDENRPDWHKGLMLREMSEPTEACEHLVKDYIRPLSEILRGIIREFLPEDQTERQGWMIGFSIIGQCMFYKIHRPVIELLLGKDEFSKLNIDLLAEHISNFTLAALGRGAPITENPARGEQSA